jgi:exosortase A
MLRVDPGYLTRAVAATQPFARNSRVVVATVVFAIVWILAWYGETTRSIVAIWVRSPTFTHGFLVVPVVLGLVWYRRGMLATLDVRPCIPAFGALVLAGFGWLLAYLGGVLSGMQFMLAAMVPLAVWAIAGTAVVRALAFPLTYFFLAVPFGEFLVPTLMDWTADFTVFALRASGVPVFREGTNFAIPGGRWSVVEECSGLNYLIASIAAGSLYAYLTFKTLRRRLAFIGLAIAIPLLANGVRAYLIVLIAHLSNNRFLTGIDHIVFGWFLFGGVVLLMFWIASLWPKEGGVELRLHGAAALPPPRRSVAPPAHTVCAGVVALACVSLWTAAAQVLERAPEPDANASVQSTLRPIPGTAGWRVSDTPALHWMPAFAMPSASVSQTFEKSGRTVGVVVLLYQGSDELRKLISTSNKIVRSGDRDWRIARSGQRPAHWGAESIGVNTLDFTGATSVAAWHWYSIGGINTASAAMGKLHEAVGKLLGRRDVGALIVLYTTGERLDAQTNQPLEAFASEMGPTVETWLRRESDR